MDGYVPGVSIGTLIMGSNLTDIFKSGKSGDVATRIEGFKSHPSGAGHEGTGESKTDSRNPVITWYDLATDFIEYGWGQSIHFASRAANESFAASIARHEHYIALRLGLRPGMMAIDLGCGVGGPLIEIARFSGARILGVNINALQLERAEKRCEAAGLGHLADWLHCDFMEIDAPDASFDAAYSIEGTCHAPDRTGVYAEIFRLLKPGGSLAVYECCMTDLFNPDDPDHRRLKTDMEYASALPDIPMTHEVDDILRKVGFELVEARDIAADAPPGIPWYQPMVGSGLSFANFRSSAVGRRLTHGLLWLLERLRIVPRGTTEVSNLLSFTAATFAEAGRLGIFTPMYFFHARKPE
ncbi:MAG: methyltransferase domain-containing protein [Candidatus Dadabacteria bacterium]|nr:methyltransferase domain-containing protein [Candidatus Dadabacteria bacterium]